MYGHDQGLIPFDDFGMYLKEAASDGLKNKKELSVLFLSS